MKREFVVDWYHARSKRGRHNLVTRCRGPFKLNQEIDSSVNRSRANITYSGYSSNECSDPLLKLNTCAQSNWNKDFLVTADQKRAGSENEIQGKQGVETECEEFKTSIAQTGKDTGTCML